jgi:eukaryotic-like serine/threonine-protein kinase
MGNVNPSAAPAYRTVGRYRIYSELASGGMATVYLGCLIGSVGFSKLVAVKCLHRHFALEPEFVAMFLDEARLASTIHHPNVVASLDVVAEQGELLVVMDYVHGETLAGLLRLSRLKGDLPAVPVVARIISDALEGLHAAHVACLAGHALDIVHRDVSPQNIIVGADGNARVLDFGIAQAALRSQVTEAGTVKGKVAYMSPEQVQGQAVDARTDVFAAGVVLWEALTGRRLFYAPDSRDAVTMLLSALIPAPSALVPGLSAALDAVVLKALDRDVDARFATAHEFAEALRGVAGEASRREVADWVGRVAKEELAERLAMLEALEASAIHTQTELAIDQPALGHGARSLPPDANQTQAASWNSIPPTPPSSRSRRYAPWFFAAAGVLTALLSWLVVQGAQGPTSLPATPELGTAAATPLRAPSRVSAAQPARAEIPVVTADSMPLAPVAPSASVAAEPHSSSRSVSKRPGQSAVSTPPTEPRVKSCEPPYRIDAAGVRRIKTECL